MSVARAHVGDPFRYMALVEGAVLVCAYNCALSHSILDIRCQQLRQVLCLNRSDPAAKPNLNDMGDRFYFTFVHY